MSEQGSPFSSQSASILIAAGPGDERAVTLVQVIRKAGLRVIYAETVNIATRASEAAACVVILRPDTWKTPTIATMLRARPDYLLPVLAEPMELPHGPWTQAAISLTGEPGVAEQEVIQALQTRLAALPLSPLDRYKRETQAIRERPLAVRKRQGWNRRTLMTIILILLILGLGGSLAYRYYHQPAAQTTNPSSSLPGTIAFHGRTYTAQTPGANCATGGGQWAQGDHYVKDKKTEVVDKYTTAQCQADGLLVTRSGDYDFYSEIFFDGIDTASSIAEHYSVQVTAAIISGDAQADVTLDVHIPDQSYGRYGFDVNTLGHWEANTASTVDGSPLHRLALGFLPNTSRTYTLEAEVDGPLMSFWINGKKVTTVTDTTYPDNSSIGFGINDSTASKPISALFSNFKYQELAPTTLSQQEVIATATGQAQASANTAYTARVPGYDCDHGAGQWQSLADDDDTAGTLACRSNGMQLVGPANAQTITEEKFYWLNGNFPENYKITAQINLQADNGGCAGLETRGQMQGGGYLFSICADGSWGIALLNGKFQTLTQGQVAAQNTYQLTAMSNGSEQSLFINGTLIKKVSNTQFTSTDEISLDVGVYQSSQPAIAVFSNFSFTPLP